MNVAKDTFRRQYRFWLDLFRPDESELSEYVDNLKEHRSFSSTIREALTLIRDLRAGNYDVLLSLFPQVVERIRQDGKQDTPPDSSNNGNLEAQIDRIEQLIISNVTSSNGGMVAAAHQAQLKQLPAPAPDDTQLIEITEIEQDSGETLNNFMRSMSGLTGQTYKPIAPKAKPEQGGIKKMDVNLALPPPDFEEDEINIFA